MKAEVITITDPNQQVVILHAVERWYNHCFKSERLTACGQTAKAKNALVNMREQLKGGTV